MHCAKNRHWLEEFEVTSQCTQKDIFDKLKYEKLNTFYWEYISLYIICRVRDITHNWITTEMEYTADQCDRFILVTTSRCKGSLRRAVPLDTDAFQIHVNGDFFTSLCCSQTKPRKWKKNI